MNAVGLVLVLAGCCLVFYHLRRIPSPAVQHDEIRRYLLDKRTQELREAIDAFNISMKDINRAMKRATHSLDAMAVAMRQFGSHNV